MPLLRTVRLKNTLIAVLGILALMLPVLMMLPAAASPTTTEYPLPTPTAYPYGITTGPDDALWFTEYGSYNIGRITTSGSITEYSTGTFRNPTDITTGPDGALWFTVGDNEIGRITTTGTVSWYSLPRDPMVNKITTGPDGALWFTDSAGDAVGRITTSGTVTMYPLPFVAEPYGITTGPDGALWFTNYENGSNDPNSIGRITTTGAITNYPIMTAGAAVPLDITTGPDGALWFTESNSNKIGRITTAGTITEYPLPPTVNSYPNSITTGPDGALWFTEANSNKIGRITTAGTITEYPLPTPTAYPYGITTGPDGALWFTEFYGNSIGRITPPDPDAVPPEIGIPTWTSNPKPINGTSTLTIPATDDQSGIQKAEYFIGDTDPGQGNGATMQVNNIQNNGLSADLTTTFGTDFPAGVYKISVRAQDNDGNWSAPASDFLVVYDASNPLGVTGKNKKDLVPSLARSDVLPGLVANNQSDPLNYGFTVDFKNGALDANNDFQFTYNTGSQCGKQNATNCHNTSVNATNIAWFVIDQTGNSRARFGGQAAVVVDGTSTTNPFTVEAVDGGALNPVGQDSVILKVYAPGANPASAPALYQVSGSLAQATSVKIR